MENKILDYENLQLLAENDQTSVFRAFDKSRSSSVILKFLKESQPSIAEIAKLVHSFEITQSLEIPGIIKALRLGKTNGKPVLVLQDVNGISLDKFLKKKPLDLRTFLQIAISLSGTLGDIHHYQIIHKDIKSANIIINPASLDVYISDFGISTRLSRENPKLINRHVLEGTISYISPEQTGRMNRDIDYRTDIYSLGVTFYEMVTGHLPFESRDSLELIHQHIAMAPPPPESFNAAIPKAISDIILKCMAKMPEDRYHSAYGLKNDLEECLQQIEEKGKIKKFVAGEKDIFDVFQIPQALYGRQKDIDTLLDVFDRINDGRSECIFISGYAGVGKTSLINEIQKPIVKKRGYFIKGKFDQLKQDVPYSGLIQALTDLIHQALTESETDLTILKHKLLGVLHNNAQIIIDLIPECELIIGKQPPPPPLGSQENQNRLKLLFRNFIRVFSKREHPLVIFLDDLQWASISTLVLVKELITDPSIQHLLLIGSYRNHDVSVASPLMITIDEIKKQKGILHELELAPLTLEDIKHFTVDTVHCSFEKAAPLAQILFHKSGGNPFYLIQFLKKLHQDNYLHFDKVAKSWDWELQEIQKLDIAENVIDLLVRKIQELPAQTQSILSVAAAIGLRFDLRLVALEANLLPSAILKMLWKAVNDEIIQPISENYRLIESQELEEINDEFAPLPILFEFTHDRVQQVAYSLSSDEEKRKIHYKLGKLLLEHRYNDMIYCPGEQVEDLSCVNAPSHNDLQSPNITNIELETINQPLELSRSSNPQFVPADRIDNIFEIISHLNIAHDQIQNHNERIQLATLNLQASRKAKNSAAYTTAYDCISIAQKLLGENSWSTHYKLTYDIYLELTECSYLTQRFENIDPLSEIILKNARTNLEKGKLYIIKIVLYTNIAQTKQAIDEGLECLQLFNIKFHRNPSKLQIMAELLKVKWKLRKTPISNLEYLPEMNNPEMLFLMNVLTNLSTPAFIIDKNLLCLLTLKMMCITIDYGICDQTYFVYISYATILQLLFRDYKASCKLADISIKIAERSNNNTYRCRANFIMASLINHWSNPLSTSEKYMQNCYIAGLESGEVMYTSFISVFWGFLEGTFFCNLSQALKNLRRYKNTIYSIKSKQPMHSFVVKEGLILALQDPDFRGHTIHYEEFDEPTYFKILSNDLELQVAFQAYVAYRMVIYYIFGLFEEALDLYNYSKPTRESIFSLSQEREINFYHSLVLAALYPNASILKKMYYRFQIRNNQKFLNKWSLACPENNSHRYSLVQAELANLDGNPNEALKYYDLSIEQAHHCHFYLEEGIASERAALLSEQQCNKFVAESYLSHAYGCYSHAEATAKLFQLRSKYPSLSAEKKRKKFTISQSDTLTTIENVLSSGNNRSTTKEGTSLDLAAVMQATTIISGAIHLETLLNELMKITIESAGADRAFLILEVNGRWLIQAERDLNKNHSHVLQGVPFEKEINLVSAIIIQYVIRTKQTVVLNDAQHMGMFTEDPYINKQKPKSILCLPVSHQGRLSSILYFENSHAYDAFTSHRLDLLQLLSGQIATSIENATLYSNLKSASDNLKVFNKQLEDYNRNLENKVIDRTKELQLKNEQLNQTLSTLKSMQKQVIQQEKLAALGSLTHGIAHEIKNPLNFINNFSSLSVELLEDLSSLYPQSKEELKDLEIQNLLSNLKTNLQKIHEHSLRIDGIVVSMLKHSKDSKGQKEMADINLLLKEYLLLSKKNFAEKYPGTSIEIDMDLDPDLRPTNIISQDIGRSLINILDNAFYAVNQRQQQSPTDYHPCISIKSQQLENLVEIAIKDNGLGIPKENRERLFHPFFTTKPTGTGTGLGLSIAYDIVVQEHAGEIKVVSQEGEFTEFIIHLPSAK
ncbi:MAG: AAA family ATPase [Parachlamydiaceae bacterium]|nr:AAA family ATPase [Parachlamydiaceae bacterium]